MTAIEWTDAVWNPVTGCSRVSPGCAHCYAMELAPRLRAMHRARGGGKWADAPDGGKGSGPAFGVALHPDVLAQPFRWRKPRRVFVNSMSDLFHEDVPNEYIAAVFGVMAAAPSHTFQVLTKRPERMAEFFVWHECEVRDRGLRWEPWRVCEDAASELLTDLSAIGCRSTWPLPNVWLGVSIENRRYVSRADVLRETPAAVRFVSAEPLLGPLVIPAGSGGFFARDRDGQYKQDWPDGFLGSDLDLDRIDWLIVGGESGSRARPMDLRWARDLRDAASDAGTAFFMKQLGGRRPGSSLDELPEDLRIREFPTAGEAVRS